MDLAFNTDPAGIALTTVSVILPTILATVFYAVIASAPGGIRAGSSGQCKLVRKKANHKHLNGNVHRGADTAANEEVIEELEELAEEQVETVPEEPEEVVAEPVAEEVEAPVTDRKKKKNKAKSQKAEAEEPVVEPEVVEEPVVEEPEVVAATPEKKKKKKNKAPAAQADMPAPEPQVVAVEDVPEAEAVVEEVEDPMVQEDVADLVEEAVEEAACAPEPEGTEEKTKKKKKKKPSKAFLMAQQFRGSDTREVDDDGFEVYVPEEEFVAVAKKEVTKKSKKEEQLPTPAPAPAPVEEVVEEEVVQEDIEEIAAEAAEDEQEEDAAAEVEEVVEDEQVEDVAAEIEEADEEETKGDDAAVEEDEEDDEDDKEDDEDEVGKEEIDVIYQKRAQVKGPRGAMLQLIEEKAGLAKPITECGGTFSVIGAKEPRKMALKAIDDIVNKGFTLLSYEKGAEDVVKVEAGKVGALIGPKGSVIKNLQDGLNVRVKLPDQSGAPRNAMLDAYVAGEEDDVAKAVQVISEILTHGCHPLTHPGVVRVEIEVDQFQKPFLIGKKGSEVKKLRDNFDVRIEVGDSDDAKTTITGHKSQVSAAERYIKELLEGVEDKVQAKREQAEKAAEEAALKAAEEEAAAAAEANENEEDERNRSSFLTVRTATDWDENGEQGKEKEEDEEDDEDEENAEAAEDDDEDEEDDN